MLAEQDSNERKSFWQRLRLAQADSPSASTSDGSASSSDAQLEEIVVTAQKRSEPLQEVPIPVSVVSADRLTETNQLRMQDYYTRIPGLSLTSDSFGQPILAIRGVTTGTGNPTVGITVDEGMQRLAARS